MDFDKDLHSTLWESSVVGLALATSDGRFANANPAMCRFLEYSVSELQKKSVRDLTHPEDVEADERLAHSVRTREVAGYDFVKRYITKSGRVVWANLRVSGIVDERGTFVAFLCQVSPLVPADTVPRTSRTRARVRWNWIKDYWAQILFVIGIIATLIVEVLKALHLRK